MGKKKKERFDFRLFSRVSNSGAPVLYARFYDREGGGRVICTRATQQSTDRDKATREAARLLATLPLERMARTKAQGLQEEQAEADNLREMKLAAFFAWFWGPDSHYIVAKADTGKPLSGEYVGNQARYVERFAAPYVPFKRTALRDVSLLLLERFTRDMRKDNSGNVVNDALDAIRTPLSWAGKRGLIDDPLDFKGIDRPAEHYRKRGILSMEELAALVALPVVQVWKPESGERKERADTKPRPRLSGGSKNKGPAPIDLRMKAAVLLAELAGLRRGEIRGLRWRAVDLERGLISIEENFVRVDGNKGPKRDSAGTLPIPEDLAPVLSDLRKIALRLGRLRGDEYVIFNTTPDRPVAESTLARGYARALQLIGIPDDPGAEKAGRKPIPGSRQDRHLSLHSGRHHYATILAEELGERAARKLTRHRSIQAFQGYADHETAEAIEAGRKALRLPKAAGERGRK